MKRFTLLLSVMILVIVNSYSQGNLKWGVDPTPNTFVKHSFSGSVSEIQPYGNGIVFIGNDGTNDIIVYSNDGESYTTAESLEALSASKLSSWQDSEMAFYYGNNTSGSEGLDMRLLNNGSASVFWEGGHASYGTEARTNVVRHDYGGATGIRYYYLGRTTDAMPPRGYDTIVYESDGTDLGTIEVTHNVGFGKTAKMTNQTNNGILETCVFNGKLHLLAGMESTMGTYSTVFAVNYNASGSDISLLAQSENESYSWVNMVSTSNYIYVQSDAGGGAEPGSMVAIASDGTYAAVNNGSPVSFKITKPVQYGDRVIAIKDQFNTSVSKVAIIDSPTDVKIINVNPEDETDEVSNIVISGSILYFVATPTGGTSTMYSLDLSQENPSPIMLSSFDTLAGMAAIGDGYLAYSYISNSGSCFTRISNGVEFNIIEFNYGEGLNFALDNPASIELLAVNNDLYQVEYTGTNTNIWKHNFSASDFPKANIQYTIKDQNTSNIIVGAELTVSNGIYTYSGTSDANGHIVFMDIEGGTYYDYTLSASGYVDVSLDRQWVSAAPDNTIELQMEEDAATAIGDNEIKNLKLFPNPVSDILQIQSEAGITSLGIYALTGTKVKEITGTQINNADVSSLSSGIYIIVLRDVDGNQTTTKITKK
ncbi:T9SS type A sorting domain-containing protein [Carboxylicivirga sp. RSCT41]|uniref:T9SS type A sorting domain-containing protein n=1 Tax=Carboxylicivirga agarovorans TaxID=3417570 RepID=UPI003D342F6F